MTKPWPIDVRLSTSDIFDMLEAAEKDPKAFSPEVLAALRDDPYRRHYEAQLEASGKTKPARRGNRSLAPGASRNRATGELG